jgi:hypothetical protein
MIWICLLCSRLCLPLGPAVAVRRPLLWVAVLRRTTTMTSRRDLGGYKVVETEHD